jgi:surfactin synthase thioesterase subunit
MRKKTDRVKLFCLPYAGGSVMVYSKWQKYLHDSVDTCPLELSGRGRRFEEPFYNNIEEAVSDLYQSIQDQLDNAPYVFFGHSMGSLLVYELIFKIRENKRREPLHTFISGKNPPHITENNRKLHKLPDREFMEEIIKLGGTPNEILKEPELLSLVIPILKADYKLLETYQWTPKNDNINCGLTVFGGTEDADVNIKDLAEWRQYTSREFNLYQFGGGHFFINEKTADIVEIINQTLIDRQVITCAK